MGFIKSGIQVITGRRVQRRRTEGGDGSKRAKGTINHQLYTKIYTTQARILSNRNAFCTLRGGKMPLGLFLSCISHTSNKATRAFLSVYICLLRGLLINSNPTVKNSFQKRARVSVRVSAYSKYIRYVKIHFDIYTGKSQQGVQHSLGYLVVTNLCKCITTHWYVIFHDNVFASYKLIEDLYRGRVLCCGTVRSG